ncbi:MAG: sigma-70 family RNA polymerase sigma factor [Niabella sp.]
MNPKYLHTDQDWLSLKEKDSQKAFSFVYQKNFELVYHFAKKLLENAQEAEDIVSESFVKLWERFTQFNNTASAKSFLMTVTRNACLNRREQNKNARQREAFFATLQGADINNGRQKEEITALVYQYIFEEIEKLPNRERQIFRLSYIEGKANEEIATLLGLTNQSVRNYKANALKTLRKVFQNKEVWAVFIAIIGDLSRQ